MPPRPLWGVAEATIESTPGRRQSSPSKSVSVDSARNGRVGRSEEAGSDSDRPRERIVGQRDLKVSLPPGKRRYVRVCERVVAELEPSSMQLPHDVRVANHLAADDEEGGRDMKTLERGCDLRRPMRVGAVIEGQRDPLPDSDVPGLEAPGAPGENRPFTRQWPPAAGHGRRAASGGPRRQPLDREEDEERHEEQTEDDPAGNGPRSAHVSSSWAAVEAEVAAASSPGRAVQEAASRAASVRPGDRGS